MARKLKITENEKYTLLGHEMWRGKLKITENEKYTLQDVKYGEEN